MSLAASLLEDFDNSASENEEGEKTEVDAPKTPTISNAKDWMDSQVIQFLKSKIDSFDEECSNSYELVMECNKAMLQLEEEIDRLHSSLVIAYSGQFSELASHVPNPIPYAKSVKLIGNATNLTSLDLTEFLSPAQSMAVTMTASNLSSALPEDQLSEVFHACDAILRLDELRENTFLTFVSTQMNIIAPNVNNILGSDIAAQLLAIVGGISLLVTIPSCNLETIGKSHESLQGFSRRKNMHHYGIIHGCSLVQDCLPEHRAKAMRVVSGRLALAARMDFSKEDTTGAAGFKWRSEIRGKLEKWHKPPPGKTKRALPVPKTDSKKKRGGKRARRLKELYGVTQVQKEANRIRFGGTGDEYGDSAMGNTYGRLGQEGSGRLRITIKEQKKVQKHTEATIHKRATLTNSLSALSTVPGTATNVISGTASSVAFTPVQGIQLLNPAAAQQRIDQANLKYFGNSYINNKK